MSPKFEKTDPTSLLDILCDAALNPSTEGIQYTANSKLLPARKVKRSRANSSVRVASHKNGCVQEVESITIEYALAIEIEHDQRVASYSAQPQTLFLDYINVNGARCRTSYTPDFLISLADGRSVLVECKPYEKALSKHAEDDPRFSLDENTGRFTDLPTNETTNPLNIPHVIITSRDINHTLVGNHIFLGGHATKPYSDGAQRFCEFLRSKGATTYSQAASSNLKLWSADDVNQCIYMKTVYVDLRLFQLGGLNEVVIYASEELYQASQTAPSDLPLISAENAPQNALAPISPKAMKTGLEKFSVIKVALLNGDTSELTRTEKTWVKNFKAAAVNCGAGLYGLFPGFHNRGNRAPRLPSAVETLLTRSIDEAALNNQLAGNTANYGKLRTLCKKAGHKPPSRQTFYKRLKSREAELDSIFAKGGASARYQKNPAQPLSEAAESRNVRLPWQLAQLDHTPLPIKLLASYTKAPIESAPWLTLLRDAGTNKILGMHLTFDRPNSDVIFACLWDCYKRHKAIPEIIALDGEKPHDSIGVETVLAELGTDKISRRFKRPRDGSLIEGAFSRLMAALITHLNGNYAARPNPQEWPEGWAPADDAEMTVAALWIALDAFCFSLQNEKMPQEKLGNLSPNEYERLTTKAYGQRGFREFSNQIDAQTTLLPMARRGGVRTLDRQHGIRIYNQPYLPTEPLAANLYNQQYPTKYDPTDIRHVLAFVDGQWTRLAHRNVKRFAGLSSAVLAAYSIEIIEYAKRHLKTTDNRAELFFEALETVQNASNDPLGEFISSTANEPEPLDDRNLFENINPSDGCGSFKE